MIKHYLYRHTSRAQVTSFASRKLTEQLSQLTSDPVSFHRLPSFFACVGISASQLLKAWQLDRDTPDVLSSHHFSGGMGC